MDVEHLRTATGDRREDPFHYMAEAANLQARVFTVWVSAAE